MSGQLHSGDDQRASNAALPHSPAPSPVYDDLPDAELVQATRDGKWEAWEVLVERHVPRLAAYLGARLRRPDIVEMLVGEAIFAAWRHLGELAQPSDFPSWLRRLGANIAVRWHHRHRQEPLVAESFPRERCADEVQFQRMQRLETALGRLDNARRMALEQRFRGAVQGEALAETLHCPVELVDDQLDAALEALVQRLVESDAEASGSVG